jgi:8-oxo-dGTP pyrophosphatase MutT (NUDIX family)
MTVTAATRHFTASALVLDHSAQHVLLVRHNLTGRWQFPGGHVDPDEDGGECAVREVAKETGLTIRLVEVPNEETGYGRLLATPLQVAEHPAPAKPAKGEPAHRHLDMLYLATVEDGGDRASARRGRRRPMVADGRVAGPPATGRGASRRPGRGLGREEETCTR